MARQVPSWLRHGKGKGRRVGMREGFRSGLEVKVSKQIEEAGYPVHYEDFKIPYMVPETRHLYTPDWRLAHNGIIIEGKGMFTAQDRAKHLFVQAQYPDLDIRFVFSNANARLYKGSKTTLADWCEKQGFKYAHKVVPPEWFKEPGPKRNPLEVIKEGPYGYSKRQP